MLTVRASFWLLSPNDDWVKAQRASHNEFVESRLKKLGFNELSNAHNGSEVLRQQSKTSLKQGNPSSTKFEENDSWI